MTLFGLYREAEYSPGRHRSNDALLLDAVGGRLSDRGLDVQLMALESAVPRRHEAALIFSMCQGPAALNVLAGWEREGTHIVNSPRAALNTYRDHLAGLMLEAGVPFPATRLVATRGRLAPSVTVNGGLWLKRGDVHATVRSDVQWIDSSAAFETARAEFAARGIAAAAVQEHRAGDEIKFYGVAGGAFFHWFHSGGPRRYPVDTSALAGLAFRAAAAARLDVFGGDVIVSPDGGLTIIDLNDWPSFAPCRPEAAEAIAGYLARRVHAVWNPGLVRSANQSAV